MQPPLNKQHPTITIDPDRLAPAHRSFNASIIQHSNRRLMAYRSHTLAQKWCSLHIATLGDDWQPIDDAKIDVPLINDEGNLEDPRLFHGPGETLWMAWTEALYVTGQWTCRQRYGPLKKHPGANRWAIISAFSPRYGRNDGSAKEKNWQFFWQGDHCFAIYSHSPQIVIELDGETIINEWRSSGMRWKYGFPSGGTPPIPFDAGHLLTFFHAYTPDQKHDRRYNMGAALIENKPPFAIKHHSFQPLMFASEKEPLAPDPRWHPLCVFPCGTINGGDVFHVSSGVNDCRCVVSAIPKKQLKLTPMETRITTDTARIALTGGVIIDGFIRNPGDIVEVKKAFALDLLRRKRAVLASGEAAPVITTEESERAIIPQKPARRRRSTNE